MRNPRAYWLAQLIAVVFATGGIDQAFAQTPVSCDADLAQAIPTRASEAPTGRALAERVMAASSDEREGVIRSELLAGNIPSFLRHLQPVLLHGRDPDGHGIDIVSCVAPDYLAVGSDDNYLLIPMRLETALEVATRFDFILPTPKLVDAIYAQAVTQLRPQPLPASDAMRSTDYYLRHDRLVRAQREATHPVPEALLSGDKKDLVLTERLWAHLDRVAIYGWHKAVGLPIQPLSTVHGWRYADYSHGVRLVSATVFVNGQRRSIYDVIEDPRLAPILSSEGVLPKARELVQVLSNRVDQNTGLQSRFD